ncbi:MAG: hypothetical protein U0R19_22255 [Bryobacteraceae bacterium]
MSTTGLPSYAIPLSAVLSIAGFLVGGVFLWLDRKSKHAQKEFVSELFLDFMEVEKIILRKATEDRPTDTGQDDPSVKALVSS